ncbi:MAG: serine hydrolase [bacterium]|nr:serine hydrolase [bacterium]MCM1376607.1 serine hydrolase [Muribaculum sp.]
MKCTSNGRIKIVVTLLVSVMVLGCIGCGKSTWDMPYDPDAVVSGFNVISRQNSKAAHTFAENLCVVTENVTNDETVDMTKAEAAILFGLNDNEVLYAKNAHEKLHPASLTKVMTALVALKYGSIDQVLTASNAVTITETGATLCGLKPGDNMTLNQALYVLLLQSANDAAMLIADNIGGSVDRFVELMNQEALELGATNTHFMNPHGLTQEEHYTTAYDLYLIFNEALKYEKFNEIIQTNSYEATYSDSAGAVKTLSVQTSNLFLRGNYKAPDNITVIGGKTGTTNAAKSCLMVLSRDAGGSPYISVILKAETRDTVYEEMIDLLGEIQN